MIDIRNLTFSYSSNGQPKTLNNLNLRIERGEQVAIVGPSGAGKSTLLKCINRLLQPSDGSIKIEGRETMGLPRNEIRKLRRGIGMIFQNFGLLQRTSAIGNVLMGRLAYAPFHRKYLYGLTYTRRDYEIALESLEQVKMGELTYRRVDNLSGGQQQRVGVARALAQKPSFILADEPVSNLDPKIKVEILDLITSICRNSGFTLIISMHEVSLVRKYIPRVIGLSEGKIVFDGLVQDLTEKDYRNIFG